MMCLFNVFTGLFSVVLVKFLGTSVAFYIWLGESVACVIVVCDSRRSHQMSSRVTNSVAQWRERVACGARLPDLLDDLDDDLCSS